MDKDDLQKRFDEINLVKQNKLYPQTRAFQQLTLFMDHRIRNNFKSFSLFALCGSERTKFMVDIHLEKTFNNLSPQEQIELYEKTVNFALTLEQNQNESNINIDVEEDSQYTEKKEPKRLKIEVEEGFRSWKHVHLTIEGFKFTSIDMNFDIRNYLLRMSKKTDRKCFVLESIHQSNPAIIRFCFLTNSDQNKYLPIIKELIDIGYKQEIKRMYKTEVKSKSRKKSPGKQPKPQKPTTTTEGSVKDKQINKTKQVTLAPLQEESQLLKNQSMIIQEIIKQPVNQNLSMQLNQLIAQQNQRYEDRQKTNIQKFKNKERWYKNVFNVIFPDYNLNQLQSFDRYKKLNIAQSSNFFIYQHSSQSNLFKVQMFLNIPPQLILQIITNVQLYKMWHPQIVQGQIKLSISSENSTIVYHKCKEYSQWYRQRDFIYLRHVFQMNQQYYIADKSIENITYIPLNTIVRGSIHHCITKISRTHQGSKVVIECQLEQGGLLNKDYAVELTTRYLTGFSKIENYFGKVQQQEKLRTFFNLQWKVHPFSNTQAINPSSANFNVNNEQFSQNGLSKLDNSQIFYSIKDESSEHFIQKQQSVHQIEQLQLQVITNKSITIGPIQEIATDSEGLVKLPKEYLKVKHPIGIHELGHYNKINSPFKDIILRDQWRIMPQGGLVLYNKKIIAAQDSVISFLASSIKKSLFSKGPLQISLPVTIFNCNSHLSQLALAMSCAPLFLQDAAKMKDPIAKMKKMLFFGFSTSALFFDIEKPFNPILGETFQAFIAGCPFYAEQISHHPPISAILMLGRGYKIYGNLQACVNVHINSGAGLNRGWLHIVFDDGQQICLQTPPAQFSGFSLGDRKFNFQGKGYLFDRKNNLYAETLFQDNSGIFSSKKWKYRDQIQSQILTVQPQFLDKFISQFPDKKHTPSNSDIISRHNKMSGRWHTQLLIDDGQKYHPNTDLPYEVVPYQYPLNSNTDYRQDLFYRKKDDLSRSQSEKQRLENIQRADRKFRAKYHPSSSH